MRKIYFIICLMLVSVLLPAQDYEITFNAVGEGNSLDSVLVQNITQETQLLIPGDAVLHLVGVVTNTIIPSVLNNNLQLFPNPMKEFAMFEVVVLDSKRINIEIFDITGKLITSFNQYSERGRHQFKIKGLNAGIYIVNVSCDGWRRSANLVSIGVDNENPTVEKIGHESIIETTINRNILSQEYQMKYNDGDVLVFTGYSGINSTVSTLIPTESQSVTQNIVSCVDPDGYSYSTVTIGEQIWMAENLRYDNGCMSISMQPQIDNGRCVYYNNDELNNGHFGILYQWSAALNGESSSNLNPSGIRGICPEGWHLPSDDEWKELEIEVGMLPEEADIGDGFYARGTNEGSKLAGIAEYWDYDDIFEDNSFGSSGFTAIPAGVCFDGNYGHQLGQYSYWWTSSYFFNSPISPWTRWIGTHTTNIYREAIVNYTYLSVRCVHDDDSQNIAPIISTNQVSEITSSTAVTGGNITSGGGSFVSSRGVVWDISPNPTIESNLGINSNGTSPGLFESEITGLYGGITYYVKAYAINSIGVSYGQELSFTTNEVTVPTIHTSEVYNVLNGSANSGGDLVNTGGADIVAKGVVWGTAEFPTIENNDGLTFDGNYMGSFVSNLTNLEDETEYYVRAYAVNSYGTGYGEQVVFTTFGLPQVITSIPESINSYSAQCGGEIVHDGGTPILLRGVVFSTEANPTIESNHGIAYNGDGSGSFDSYLTKLFPETTYYARAYAKNNQGVRYGENLVFTTSAFQCNDSLTYESYVYSTILFDGMCWLGENLKYLPTVGPATNGSLTLPCYYVYGNNTSSVIIAKQNVNYLKHGVLYNYPAAMSACPPGWHLPSSDDWTDLERAVCSGGFCSYVFPYEITSSLTRGTNEGSKLAGSFELWSEGSLKSDPEFGVSNFNITPAGIRGNTYDGQFASMGGYGVYWTSSTYADNSHASRSIRNYESGVYCNMSSTDYYGFSVRCKRDVNDN